MGVQSAVGSAEQGRSTERAMAVELVALLDQATEIAIRWPPREASPFAGQPRRGLDRLADRSFPHGASGSRVKAMR